jgi:hypothetical protein
MSEELSVEYRDGEIVVTRRVTAFSARYHKPDREPTPRVLAAAVATNRPLPTC